MLSYQIQTLTFDELKKIIANADDQYDNQVRVKISCTGCTNNSDNSLQFMKIHGVSLNLGSPS